MQHEHERTPSTQHSVLGSRQSDSKWNYFHIIWFGENKHKYFEAELKLALKGYAPNEAIIKNTGEMQREQEQEEIGIKRDRISE